MFIISSYIGKLGTPSKIQTSFLIDLNYHILVRMKQHSKMLYLPAVPDDHDLLTVDRQPPVCS